MSIWRRLLRREPVWIELTGSSPSTPDSGVVLTPATRRREAEYAAIWDHYAQENPLVAVYGTDDQAVFEEGGRHDAERFRQWTTAESVVLNVGCGLGRVERYLAPHVAAIHTVDISAVMLAHARQRLAGLANVHFHQASATNLGIFPDASFDFAWSVLVLQHLEKEDAYLALREIHRVLKPHARAFLQFPHLLADAYFAGFERAALAGDRNLGRGRPYTVDEARFLVEKAGLGVEELRLEGPEIIVLARKGEVPTPAPPGASPHAASRSPYAQFWDKEASTDPLLAVYATHDEAAFEEGGRLEAERFRQWTTAESVVLNVGCGLGRVERYLAPHVAAIHTVDVSAVMLAHARQRLAGLANVHFHQASATNLGIFPDASFDFAWSVLVLQHLEKEDAYLALREIHRVLKPHARAYLQFPNILHHAHFAGFQRQALLGSREIGRTRFYAPEEAELFLQGVGLRVVERWEVESELYFLVEKGERPVEPEIPAPPAPPESEPTAAAEPDEGSAAPPAGTT